MADAPWRCSQCGTVNEPVANACRTCGRWPSLFDLEESKVPEVAVEEYVDELEPLTVEAPELETFEPEVFEPDAPGGEPESSTERGRRIIGSVLVPLAIVVYLLISVLADR